AGHHRLARRAGLAGRRRDRVDADPRRAADAGRCRRLRADVRGVGLRAAAPGIRPRLRRKTLSHSPEDGVGLRPSHRRPRMSITRRTLIRSAAASAALAAVPASAQTTWPERPVRIIVPYPAGGSADVLARFYADALKEKFGQPFVIENRP